MHTCAQHRQYLNSHGSVTCKHQDRLVEVSLLSGALTEGSRHQDVHFRAQVVPSRKAYDEKHSDLGSRRGIGGVCMNREKDFSTYREIPRKKSHEWLRGLHTQQQEGSEIQEI